MIFGTPHTSRVTPHASAFNPLSLNPRHIDAPLANRLRRKGEKGLGLKESLPSSYHLLSCHKNPGLLEDTTPSTRAGLALKGVLNASESV